MSQENVEVVRRFIDQYGDALSDLQGLAANFFEPDADYYPVQKFPEARPWRPLPMCVAAPRALHAVGGPPVPKGRPSRTGTEWGDLPSRRAAGVARYCAGDGNRLDPASRS
jgi:hypothetical protein